MSGKERLRIAVAAHSPVYLPLWVAEAEGFYGLSARTEIEIVGPPTENQDNDSWALKQVEVGNAHFAVCDPIPSPSYKGSLWIAGTLISRAAFWAVYKGNRRRFNLQNFLGFERIITYPPGMTADRIAKFCRKYAARQLKIKNVGLDAVLPLLESSNRQTIALTADLPEALALEERNYTVEPLWELHPNLHNFLLTAVVTSRTNAQADGGLTSHLIRALSNAASQLTVNPEVGARCLVTKSSAGTDRLPIARARRAVDRLIKGRIYPFSPVVDLGAWHNAWRAQDGALAPTYKKRAKQKVRESMKSRALIDHSSVPTAVERSNHETIVRFSDVGVDHAYLKAIDDMDEVSHKKTCVVGNYCRYHPVDINNLRKFVGRLKRQVKSSSGIPKNYFVWSPSGQGKSFLFEELGREKDPRKKVLVKIFNITKPDERQQYEVFLKSNSIGKRPTLCVVDEIDASTAAMDGAYEPLMEALKLRRKGRQINFVLLGSGGGSVEGLKEKVKTYEDNKGPDVVSRTSLKWTIPPIRPEDGVVVCASAVRFATPNWKTREIEKLAVYFLLAEHRCNPREIADSTNSALERIRHERVVRYEDFFGDGEEERRRQFLVDNASVVMDLSYKHLVSKG